MFTIYLSAVHCSSGLRAPNQHPSIPCSCYRGWAPCFLICHPTPSSSTPPLPPSQASVSTLSLPAYLPKPTAPSSHSARGLSCAAHGTLTLSPGSCTPASQIGYLPASRHSASFSFAHSSFHLKRKLPGFYVLHDHLISFFLHSQVFERVIHTNLSFSHLALMNRPAVIWFLPPSHLRSD